MEAACHELDLSYALTTGSLGDQGGVSFEKYTSSIHQLFLLKEESEKQRQVVSVLEQLNTFMALTLQLPEGNPSLDEVRREAQVQRKQLQDVVKF